eukprot:TRINITY_DN4946_c0_g1_i2.p1 TRINITY_DN4946_c0_g1~~TRINITY_DN4946_c0_g1_i2.p1  ORF type:complete len:210 (+),score=2.70 TRINITY_DN4946_c0_g1_i2:68-697(+)
MSPRRRRSSCGWTWRLGTPKKTALLQEVGRLAEDLRKEQERRGALEAQLKERSESAGSLEGPVPELAAVRPSEVASLTAQLQESDTSISPSASCPTITPSQLYTLQGDVMVVDVRTSLEYQWKHIPGAMLLDQERVLREVPRDRPVVLCCLSGHRGVPVARWLQSHGYVTVYNLDAGLWGWCRAGYPSRPGATPLTSSRFTPFLHWRVF